jgi:histidine transport system permease protein
LRHSKTRTTQLKKITGTSWAIELKENAMSLVDYGPLIASGTWMTLKLAMLSLLTAVVIGLAGASSKLSGNRWLRNVATLYTTLIRSVPDLVTMLLLFYSIQIVLNQVTEGLGMDQIDIDPFLAGVATLGFIYGAYFTETFRGAFQAVPRGQTEAAMAYGLSPWQAFYRILFPQMMRFALPGIANNWQVMIKATALVSIIGLSDIVRATQDAGKSSMQLFYFTVIGALIYLFITTVSNGVLIWLKHHYSVGVREAEL